MQRITWTNSFLALGIAGSLGLTGCDSQVDGDYPGESLATVHGTISSSRTLPTPAAHAGVFWLANYDEEGSEELQGETVEVSGDFPAEFTLDLFELPPEAAMDADLNNGQGATTTRVAVGMISVTDIPAEEIESIRNGADEETILGHFLGAAEEHVIIYAEAATGEYVSASGEYIPPLQAGYNLLKLTYGTQEQEDCWELYYDSPDVYDICTPWLRTELVPEGVGAVISIRLVDDPNSIDFPLL